MRKVAIGSAVAVLCVLLAACGKPGVETYNPGLGVTPDCSKYVLEANRTKCVQAEGRH